MPRPAGQRARLVSARYSEPPRPHLGPGPASTPHTGPNQVREVATAMGIRRSELP